MNKFLILCFIVVFFVAAPAAADKPEWAGKGKPSMEQKKAHKSAMNQKETSGYEDEDEKGKGKKHKKKKEKKLKKQGEESKGMEKQKDKKSEQMQKELDKGSEEGKANREKRKKWWQFGN